MHTLWQPLSTVYPTARLNRQAAGSHTQLSQSPDEDVLGPADKGRADRKLARQPGPVKLPAERAPGDQKRI